MAKRKDSPQLVAARAAAAAAGVKWSLAHLRLRRAWGRAERAWKRLGAARKHQARLEREAGAPAAAPPPAAASDAPGPQLGGR
jgi:hypothetical protein